MTYLVVVLVEDEGSDLPGTLKHMTTNGPHMVGTRRRGGRHCERESIEDGRMSNCVSAGELMRTSR